MVVNKRVIVLLSLVAVITLAIVGGTIAYYQTQTVEVDNAFGVGDVDVTVEEEFPPFDPGKPSAVKVVTLKNTGNVDAYVRAMLVPAFRSGGVSAPCDVDYTELISGNFIKVTAPDGAVYKLNLASGWQTNWRFSPTDNSFCYRLPLPKGSVTNTLLQTVSKEGGGNWKELNVEVLSEATQTQGNDVEEYLKQMWGVQNIGTGGKLEW